MKNVLWYDPLVNITPKIGSGIFILFVFWILSIIVQKIIVKVSTFDKVDPDLLFFLKSAAKWAINIFGLVVALGTLGVDVTALVAGLSLTGFALGYALKDVVSNSIAGMMVIIYKPFKRNDKIKVGWKNYEGRVKGIDLRYTIVQNDDKDLIYIPNSLLFTEVVYVLKDDNDEAQKEDLKLNHLSLD